MITKDDLYELLPVVTRLRDAEVGSPLERLIGVLAGEADVLDRDIERLYDNWFIETCDPWLVPYIGDLIGVRPLFPVGPGAASGRAYVANTIGYRRRKGTVGVLEQLAFDVTGWGAKAVEFFELLGTTQYLNHLRPENVRTPDLRDGNALDLLDGPFERIAHTAEVRRIPRRRGRYNIPNVGIFLWRLGSYPLERVTARRIGAKADGTWTFNSLGLDTPLFNRPEADRGIVDLAGETDVPTPLRRRAVRDSPDDYLAGARPVLEVFSGAAATGPLQPVAAEKLVVADLRLWQRPTDPATVGLDPVLGRLTFPAGEEPERVEVSYAYGFGHDIGGGPYDRQLPAASGWHRRVGRASPADPAADFDSLADAVAAWNGEPAGTRGTITILDSRTYDESAVSPIHVEIPAESGLAIVASERMRPHIRADLEIVGTAVAADVPGELTIDGLLLEGAVTAVAGNLGRLRITDATIVPGSGAILAASAAGPGNGNAELTVELERSICGDISLAETVLALSVMDTIVEGALDAPGTEVDIERTTIDGDMRVRLLRAGNSIFAGAVVASRRQEGCVRFCFLPRNPATATPRRYRCQPDLALKAAGAPAQEGTVARVVPTFTSTAYGDPGYRQLDAGCPPEIATGAEDGSEMGAFSSLKQPQREANLRTALDEYLRFGLEAGAFYVT